MSKELELLRRAVEEWSSDRDLYSFDKIMQEIEDHLAAEEANTIEVPRDIYVHLKKGRVTPSDLVEAVKKAEQRKPLSDEEIDKQIPEIAQGLYGIGFYNGVRFAEKHHGISGGGDENPDA